jgi:hypothetical protein
MLKYLARWYARKAYILKLEVEGKNHDIHAKLADLHAQQKREQSEKLNKDADAIDANIKAVAERLEAGYWECENGHEHDDMRFKDIGRPDVTGRVCLECEAPVKHVKRSDMSAQEQYEADKGRKEAEKMAENYRVQAAACEKDLSDNEKAAQHFRRESARSRAVADEIRKI